MLNAGSIIGGIFGTTLGGTSIYGIPGWRFAFYLTAAISFTLSMLIYFLGVDPSFPKEYQKVG